MKKRKLLSVILLWAALAAAAWFGPKQASSDTERRPLAQLPDISSKTVLSGKFMSDFEKFTLDQFPLRDGFRELKSWFQLDVLKAGDNNGFYTEYGHIVKQEYPLNVDSLEHALERFGYLYDKYLGECKVYAVVIPDKNFILSRFGHHLTMDYDRLYEMVEEGMPWATHLDLRPWFGKDEYYRTDTHWRQEELVELADFIGEAMGADGLRKFTVTPVNRPFYGVYYGQAAVSVEPDIMYLLESPILEECRVYDYETGKYSSVYDREKLAGKDMYEVFLSGSKSLLTIENPNASSDRELIIFRDSFGSSIAPLLVPDYAKITLVDIRYIQSGVLSHFIEFKDQDVLFLYSTLVLNNSNTMK